MKHAWSLVGLWVAWGWLGTGCKERDRLEPSQVAKAPSEVSTGAKAEEEEEEVTTAPEADPFAAPGAPGFGSSLAKIPAAKGRTAVATLLLRYECWETGAREGLALLDGAGGTEVGDKARQALLANPSARLVHALALTLDEKTKASGESIVETIYPTEYEAPELSRPLAEQAAKVPAAETKSEVARLVEQLLDSACPTAFETRNTGVTLEAELRPAPAEAGCWDLSLAVEEVLLLDWSEFGSPAVKARMPRFASARGNHQARLAEGRWQMLGMQAPPRGRAEDPADRVRLGFARLVRAR